MKKINESQPLLINCMEEYLEYLNSENIPLHQHRLRDRAYVNKIDRYFKYYLEGLKLHNVDVGKLKFTDVDNQLLCYLTCYLSCVKKYNPFAANKIMKYLKVFSDYTILVYNLNMEGESTHE